jgi:hypothetical protein
MPKIPKESGVVAILDALGASSYDDRQINRFLDSRDRVISNLKEWAESDHGSVAKSEVHTFTFNDTIVLVLKCPKSGLMLERAAAMAAYLRQFIVSSMADGMLFRGSAALGSFYMDEESNTVMGEAVVDAAQWYEEAQWVGVHFTPRSTLLLRALMEEAQDDKRWALFPYDVPLSGGLTLNSFAINWPKIFLLPKLRPWGYEKTVPRVKLLQFLSAHKVPQGTQHKYFNTLTFFEVSLEWEAKQRAKKRPKTKK